MGWQLAGTAPYKEVGELHEVTASQGGGFSSVCGKWVWKRKGESLAEGREEERQEES